MRWDPRRAQPPDVLLRVFLHPAQSASVKTLSCSPPSCPSDTFQCKDKSKCLSKRLLCDKTNHCDDQSDEECECGLPGALFGCQVSGERVFLFLISISRLEKKNLTWERTPSLWCLSSTPFSRPRSSSSLTTPEDRLDLSCLLISISYFIFGELRTFIL